MTADVQGIGVPGKRDEALELLEELEVSALPALKRDTDELIGILRLRDFFENPDEEQLGMLVNRDVTAIDQEASLEDAADKMLETGERRLPVVKDGELTGIITVRDIVYRAIIEKDIETSASEFMQESVLPVWEETPLQAAVEILSCTGARALPAINSEGRLSGMIGDEDIINISEIETEETAEQMKGRSESEKWAWNSEDVLYVTKHSLKPPDKTVKEAMTKDVVTVTKRTPAAKCAKLMRDNKIDQTPVLSGRKLIGVVRDEDLLKVLIE